MTVMKTLRGARLNDMRPYEKDDATYAQAALRWVLSNPHVDAAVITMNSVDKVNEFLGASGWRKLAYHDMRLLEQYARLNHATYCDNVCKRLRGRVPVRCADRRGAAHADVRRGLSGRDLGATRIRDAEEQRRSLPVL